MPASLISLQYLLAAVREKGRDLKVFEKELLLRLRNHQIRAVCGEYVKSNLVVINSFRDIEEATLQEFLPALEERPILEQASKGEKTIHIWAGDNYFTFAHSDQRWEVYTDGDYREKFSGKEIDPSWYPFAWLDDDRYALLCEDLDNRSRFVFEKISFDRRDIASIDQAGLKAPKKRGAKPRYVDDIIVAQAKELLLRQPNIKAKEFKEIVLDWLGPNRQPGDTQFQKLYGYLRTEHNRDRKNLAN